jgi:hypothetical protein
MGAENRPHAGQPGHGADAPSLAAVPFLEKELDELYDALSEARHADALVEAKISLQAGDYSKALQLVEAVRQWCTWLGNRPRAAAVSLGGRAARAVSAEVLSRLATVVRLLQPLSDWHQRQTKTRSAASVGHATARARRSGADELARSVLPGDTAEDAAAITRRYLSPLLERRIFHQLFKSAQLCGLVPNPDAIKAVRDREVLTGKYQKAYEKMEAMYTQFNAQAAQRATDLRREAVQYKAGKLKMPVKDWLARQRRVAEQNQEIERARLYFTRVLDALRAIRMSSPE